MQAQANTLQRTMLRLGLKAAWAKPAEVEGVLWEVVDGDGGSHVTELNAAIRTIPPAPIIG